jgi:DNA-binding transcriptional LysR family regulator
MAAGKSSEAAALLHQAKDYFRQFKDIKGNPYKEVVFALLETLDQAGDFDAILKVMPEVNAIKWEDDKKTALRIIKLNMETVAAFSDAGLSGRVRLGVPDDYADRYLPEIMARFSRAYPGVELSVMCEPSVDLLERIDSNELDLAIITNCDSKRASEPFRRERLLWVTSNRHPTHMEERLPLALGRPACGWRRIAIEALEGVGRPYRLLYSSSNAGAVAAAVLSGLAVSVLAESGLRPGMRVLTAAEGFPELTSCRIGLVRNPHERGALADALAEHIISSLDNLTDAAQAAE